MNKFEWKIDPSYGVVTMFRLYVNGRDTCVTLSLEVKQDLHSTLALDLHQEVVNLIMDELLVTEAEANRVVVAFKTADVGSSAYSDYEHAMKIVEKK